MGIWQRKVVHRVRAAVVKENDVHIMTLSAYKTIDWIVRRDHGVATNGEWADVVRYTFSFQSVHLFHYEMELGYILIGFGIDH